ncbi:isocitrate lyase/PEP mutase family protein [Actinomadura kijaniata]|uniref:isocitrate lyase/PEP mutase family protein n=1 Tax=Actinomadura kijaniata TaxID=46161 RepID=UPI0008337F5B|nr:isocitrate lyase/phosphoenolpyruvate mutase family protein [Actinomadura kijaniata]
MVDRCAQFRSLHHADTPLLLPNAWDHASAALLLAAGFEAVGTTSLGVAAAAGKPDASSATLAETLALAATLAPLPCPVTVDIEGGFGDVAHLAGRLAALGVAGVNIEDGRPDGTLAEPAELQHAIRVIKETAPDLFVNARTDAFWLDTPDPLAAALDRAALYRDAGADGVFVPGVAEPADIAELTALGVPVNVLFLPGRHTVAELGDLGVRRVSTGSLLYRAALAAGVATARAVRDDGEIPTGIPSYEDLRF